jgi:hypothetical protein
VRAARAHLFRQPASAEPSVFCVNWPDFARHLRWLPVAEKTAIAHQPPLIAGTKTEDNTELGIRSSPIDARTSIICDLTDADAAPAAAGQISLASLGRQPAVVGTMVYAVDSRTRCKPASRSSPARRGLTRSLLWNGPAASEAGICRDEPEAYRQAFDERDNCGNSSSGWNNAAGRCGRRGVCCRHSAA